MAIPAILIDDHDNERIYRYVNDNGKYLFKIENLTSATTICESPETWLISYFDRNEWHRLAKRKTKNISYLETLAMKLLDSFSEAVK